MSRDTDFITEMSVNFAKYIYTVLGVKFGDNLIPVSKLQENFKKANAYDAKLLTLMYGSIGIM